MCKENFRFLIPYIGCLVSELINTHVLSVQKFRISRGSKKKVDGRNSIMRTSYYLLLYTEIRSDVMW
jgi:hypothetical protein